MSTDLQLSHRPRPDRNRGLPTTAGHGPSAAITDLKQALASHTLPSTLRDVHGLRLFMEHHVVCVWDFMSMLKSLQRDLTSVAVPWLPSGDTEGGRLINEMVLCEESDVLPEGPDEAAGQAAEPRFASHFEWYLAAMDEVGCDRVPVNRLVEALRTGSDPVQALAASGLPPAAVAFSRNTWSMMDEPLAVRVAVFHHAREDLIPELLAPLAKQLHQEGTTGRLFVEYLERHVEVDGEVHGPMSERLLTRQFEKHPELRERALDASAKSLGARLELWDAIAGLAGERQGR